MGDFCDPYPSNADNLTACIDDNQVNKDEELRLVVLVDSLESQALDTDNDGVLDNTDKCAATISETSVDQAGCSISNFCSVYSNKRTCNAADWMNDEPVKARDCRWSMKTTTCNVR